MQSSIWGRKREKEAVRGGCDGRVLGRRDVEISGDGDISNKTGEGQSLKTNM